MNPFTKIFFFGSLNFALFFAHCSSPLQLSAYVNIPRSTLDTTDKMNAGGDPPERTGLRDQQRSPEYVDDYWGRNDYHYSTHGIKQTGTVLNPYYDTYYPLPNTYYPSDSSNHNNSGRSYRPGYPR